MTRLHVWSASDEAAITNMRCPSFVKQYLRSVTFRNEFYGRQTLKARGCVGCRDAGGRDPPWGQEPELAGVPLPEVARRLCICGLNKHMATALNQFYLLLRISLRANAVMTNPNDPARVSEIIRIRVGSFRQWKAADAVARLGLARRMENNVPVYHDCGENAAICTCEMSPRTGAEVLEFINRRFVSEIAHQAGEGNIRADIIGHLQRLERYDRLSAYEHCSACFRDYHSSAPKICTCFVCFFFHHFVYTTLY